MKKVLQGTSFVLFVIIFAFDSCKTNVENPIQGISLVTLTSNGVNINFGNSRDTARDVSTVYNIVATFSNDVDFTTITKTTVKIMRDTSTLKLNFIVEGKTLTIDPVYDLLSGAELRMIISDSVRSINGFNFKGDTVNFFTLGVGVDTPPQKLHQILYVQFNNGVNDLTLHDSVTYAYLTYGVDRYGVANQAGNFSGTSSTVTSGNIVELTPLNGGTVIPPSITLSVWLNIPNLAYRSRATGFAKGILGVAGERGYYLEIIGDSATGPEVVDIATDHITKTGYDNSVDSVSGLKSKVNINSLLADGWHQVVITYDATTSLKTFYIDGHLEMMWKLKDQQTGDPLGALALNTVGTTPYNPMLGAGLDSQLTLGFYSSKENTESKYFQYQTAPNTFVGLMDDLRIFDVAFSVDEVNKLYAQEAAPR